MTPEQFVFWLRGYLASGAALDHGRLVETLATVDHPAEPVRLKSAPTLPVHTPTRLPHAPWFHFARNDDHAS